MNAVVAVDPGFPSIDTKTANVGRIYNGLLGGEGLKDTFEADRLVVEQVLAANPQAGIYARANRTFVGRMVRYLAVEQGVRQFLDIGTGYPNLGNVHEVAQRYQSEARVVYVDNDPVVAQHGRALLATDECTKMLDGDLREPGIILHGAAKWLDFSQPTAVLLVAVMHFVKPRFRPWEIVRTLMSPMASGSFLVLTHVVRAPVTVAGAAPYVAASEPVVLRHKRTVRSFFSINGLSLVEPGLVPVPSWRPDPEMDIWDEVHPRDMAFVAGVARKS
ncbi:SAM-dependent methyltransferase [Nonomuraea rhizosphaerae]|uniref:SAM-dependent methyltransferase n=1 Tax=Nonomuraea rhizosphaerae TaxID=2665663 RepID=UPI001C603009|nr:SAM-dependent methyltransferase [Nonomuraea rhizosphaerae]